MSAAGRTGLRATWRKRARRWRTVLNERVALDRWYPHGMIALLLAPLGLLLLDAAVRAELGVGLFSLELGELEKQAGGFAHRPVLEVALGLSMLLVSIGIALRAHLAWLWSVAAMVTALSLRLPPDLGEVPLAIYFAVVLALLVLYRRSFASRGVVTSGMFAIVILATFFIWATLGTLRLGEQFDPPVRDVVTALYVSLVTVSSVGYGDIVARGEDARLFVMAMIAIGVTVIATSLSAILLPLIGGRVRDVMEGRVFVERSSHYIIVGKSPLARNAAVELEKRKQRVTLVVEGSPEEDFYKHRDVVVGDPTDLEILRTAGTEEAKGVLALSADDATNGFVVLGVNELDPTIATVAALNDPSNEFRLKRTQPSLLLSLQSLGGELLAMALTGERVDVEMLTRVLQIQGAPPETEK